MTAPLHHPLLPADGRGKRSSETLLRISQRDDLLRVAVAKFFSGLSQREAARRLHAAISQYRNGRWRRDRVEATMPVQHQGKMIALLFALLRVRDHIPSERAIRSATAQFRNSTSKAEFPE